MEGAVEVVLRDKRLKGLMINLYEGINPVPEAAEGIIKATSRKKHAVLPEREVYWLSKFRLRSQLRN